MPDNSEEFARVRKDGKTYLGRRTRDMAGQWGDFDWTDLTVAPVTGYPADVCTVALAIQGNDVKIKAITKTGTVHHTHCGTNGRAVTGDAALGARTSAARSGDAPRLRHPAQAPRPGVTARTPPAPYATLGGCWDMATGTRPGTGPPSWGEPRNWPCSNGLCVSSG
ncbi:hypothetical protein [Streptomyces sp. NPDC059957]|uniref:hypothetical protein n=1 Tax=unclassified Streptomyces TaxID=2593676 RepID=UPI00364F97CB